MNHLVKPARLSLIDGTTEVVVRPRQAGAEDPIMCKNWDLGAPDVRYTSVPNPGADGVTESNGYLGSRQITLDLQIMGGRDPKTGIIHDAYWYATVLTRMTRPTAQPVLVVDRDDETSAGKSWVMRLRGSPYSISFGQRAAAVLELQLVFVCPLGMLEALEPFSQSTTDLTADDEVRVQLYFPCTFPIYFDLPPGVVYPQLVVDVGGDTPVTPVVYIHGPVTDPEIVCDDGSRFRFAGLTLKTGDAVQIDMGTGDIRLGTADSAQIVDDMSAYTLVDWGVSTYWVWPPGRHTVVYRNTHGSITVQYRERRFTV